MSKPHEKFMVLELKSTGKRCIVTSDFRFDKKLYDVCAYGPTRQSCHALMFLMKLSVSTN